MKIRAYRWGLYLLVPGRLHLQLRAWGFHVCRANGGKGWTL